MTVSLTGFMGCGKSSVGKRLSSLLSCKFIDLDSYIETKYRRNISSIFEEEGEAVFRKAECEALEEIFSEAMENTGNLIILSLGGGTLTTETARRLVMSYSVCIYLKASTETLVNNLENDLRERPVLGNIQKDRISLKSKICSIMGQRSGTYENSANYIFEIDGKDFDQIAEEIKCLLVKTKLAGKNERPSTIWDPLRKKDVTLTPEEKVRQWCIKMLNSHMQIPMHMMNSEVGFKLGEKMFRADILVYDRAARPLAVVECKRPEIKLDSKVIEQVIRYNMVLNVKYIIITNGFKTFIFTKCGGIYTPADSAPTYENMLK